MPDNVPQFLTDPVVKATDEPANCGAFRSQAPGFQFAPPGPGEPECMVACPTMREFRGRMEALLAQLGRSEARYRTLIASTSCIVWVTNPDGTSAEPSPSWQAYTGLGPDEEAGHGWTLSLHPEDRERVFSEWQKGMVSKAQCETECRIRRRDGEYRLFKVQGVPILDENQTICEWVGTCTDITEHRRAEEELRRAQSDVLEASRLAGMADVATGVIHNIGNVLNSVNIASTCLAEGMKKSKGANLQKLVALLEEHSGDLPGFFANDPRARQVPSYLRMLADKLDAENAEALNELARLQKSVEHIRDIVTMQQNYARSSAAIEEASVSDLIEDALHMNFSDSKQSDITVLRDIRPMPRIPLQKHKLLQILINLIRNSKDACRDVKGGDKKILLSASCGEGLLRISVTDNGAGIAPENLQRLFTHGFTTKKNGHGFGLHSSALAAREMGGNLTAQSDGPGHGATFTVTIPAKA